MDKNIKDITRSVLTRLRNRAIELGLPKDNMFRLYCQEALLARIAYSRFRGQLILKGGLNLYARYQAAARPTQDMDIAARQLSHDVADFRAVLGEGLALELPDHVRFDPDFQSEPIAEEAAYPGVRAWVRARLGASESLLQLDVSFGNPFSPAPEELRYPALLGSEPHTVLGYPLPNIVAEKYAAMVELGVANTRAKDFFDLYHIATHEVLRADELRQAFIGTFAGRGTPIPTQQTGWVLTEVFTQDEGLTHRWGSFLRRSGLKAPNDFAQVVGRIARLVEIPDGVERWELSGGGWMR